MRKPNLVYTFILVMLSLMIVDDIQAQRRSSSSRRTTSRSTDDSRRSSADRRAAQEKETLAEQWFSIHLGNVGFNQGFSLSTKFSYGFEFEDRFSIGANARIFYDFVNIVNGSDLNLLTYGIGPQARIKVVEEFFVIGEYNFSSIERFGGLPRLNILSPFIGAGYKSGTGPWTYGAHILFPLSEEFRDNQQSIEFWIDFNYKF